MYKIIPVLILCLCALTNAKYETCPSTKGSVDVNGIRVSNCNSNDPRCTLKRNTNATIEFNFTVLEQVQKVEAIVHGIMMNVPVPFPIPNAEVCADPLSDVTCPVESGKVHHYKATLPVLKSYPKVNVDVKWELKNENAEVLACILIPVKIR